MNNKKIIINIGREVGSGGHKLRLHVGWEAWVDDGTDVHGFGALFLL